MFPLDTERKGTVFVTTTDVSNVVSNFSCDIYYIYMIP